MNARPYVTGLLAMAGLVLVSACDNPERLAAPTPMGANMNTAPSAPPAVIAPAPIVSALGTTVCVDVRGGTNAAPAQGAPLQVWQCHGGTNQKFVLQPSGAITAYDGQRCLDVRGAKANDGDAVVAWPCHGGTNQKWTYTAAGQLQSAINGKCLDLWGAKGENGASIVVWSCHGGTNQKWTVASAATVAVAPVQPTAPPATPATPVAPSGSVGSAELPRVYLNTAMPTVTGRTINVSAGGDLQGALDAAQPGDQVVLAAGATFTGNFTLPAKAGMSAGKWIVVRSGGSLPGEGTRVGPGNAGQMPKILTPNSEPAIATAPATQGWRLVGLEVGASPRATMTYAFIALGTIGANQRTLAQAPSRLIVDRSYVHGTPQYNVRRCIVLNSAATAVIDSYIADCHSNDSDSQGIFGWSGPGPFKITNNHIEGGHEVVFFGGQTPSITGLIPSDIEVRGNHITRPLAWRGVWRAKNLFECKSCQRVLVEGNVLENNWIDAQNGFAVVLQGLSDDNDAPQERIWDVTIRNNIIRNTPSGINLLSRVAYNGGSLPSEPARRITISNNVVVVNSAISGAGRALQLLADLHDVTIAQNTFVDANGGTMNAGASFDDASNVGPMVNLRLTNNVFGPAQYSPVMGNGTVGGTGTLARFAPNGVIAGNLFVNASPSQFPSGNYYASSLSDAGLAGIHNGSFTLQPSSTIAAQFATTPGAQIGSITAATAGVVR